MSADWKLARLLLLSEETFTAIYFVFLLLFSSKEPVQDKQDAWYSLQD